MTALSSENKNTRGALTLTKLHQLTHEMLAEGYNPNNEVLIFKDPEGNGYVTVDDFCTLVKVLPEPGFRFKAEDVHPIDFTTYDPDAPPHVWTA